MIVHQSSDKNDIFYQPSFIRTVCQYTVIPYYVIEVCFLQIRYLFLSKEEKRDCDFQMQRIVGDFVRIIYENRFKNFLIIQLINTPEPEIIKTNVEVSIAKTYASALNLPKNLNLCELTFLIKILDWYDRGALKGWSHKIFQNFSPANLDGQCLGLTLDCAQRYLYGNTNNWLEIVREATREGSAIATQVLYNACLNRQIAAIARGLRFSPFLKGGFIDCAKKKLSELSMGLYAIHLEGEEGDHVILLSKEKKCDFIVDANIGLLRAIKSRAKEMFELIAGFYKKIFPGRVEIEKIERNDDGEKIGKNIYFDCQEPSTFSEEDGKFTDFISSKSIMRVMPADKWNSYY